MVVLNNQGDMLHDQKDLVGALKRYRDGLAMTKELTKGNPSNAGLRDLAYANWQVAKVLLERKPKSKSQAHGMLEEARNILETLNINTSGCLTGLQQQRLNSIKQLLNEK